MHYHNYTVITNYKQYETVSYVLAKDYYFLQATTGAVRFLVFLFNSVILFNIL